MIVSLITSLMRVTFFWYLVGLLVLFIGDPQWAEALYTRLSGYPWVPELAMHGLGTAAKVQLHLLMYWTLPLLAAWTGIVGLGYLTALGYSVRHARAREQRLDPRGNFYGVTVGSYSLGPLALPTTPALTGARVTLPGSEPDKDAVPVMVYDEVLAAIQLLSPDERQLCEELLQLLRAHPHHFAGHGHGVGLLEHTLNVMTEAAPRCTPEFHLPVVAALAHDIGKLITFKPDGKDGWVRKGLHSREGARILATLPAFQRLPELSQRALLLAIKYDHAPSKMPVLRGENEASQLAMRIISALSQADRSATAAEKDRNLVKLKPEDLLWQDFVSFLREAPIVQRGKKGVSNQVNNPPDSPYLYIYEAPWRDAALPRLPAEVAAALDLTRRDAGKLAKYTRILIERLRKEGLLVESHNDLQVSDTNPLWDIQSGTGEKSVVLRGIIVLKADALWKALNYRLSVKSPFPVQILAPNASMDGTVNQAPSANKSLPAMPDVSDGLKLADVASTDALASLGLTDDAPVADPESGGSEHPPAAVAKPKARGRFHDPAAASPADELFGLKPATTAAPPNAEPSNTRQDTPVEATPAPSEDAESSSRAIAMLAAALKHVGGDPGRDTAPALPAEIERVAPPPAEAEALIAEAPPAEPEAVRAPAQTQAARAEAPAPVLSRAETREGLAIADEAACLKYPKLAPGDKYYTEHSRAVLDGLKQPGSRYKGDDKAKQVELTSAGPRRARRKTA